MQLTMLGEAATFLRSYGEKHYLTAAETTRRALSLLALVDEMAEVEHLAVVNEREQTVEAVDLTWRQRFARRVPDLGGNRPARRRSAR